MNNKELIESGELELYVAGLLSDERSNEITQIISTNKAVEKEVEEIEAIVMRLAKESTISNNQKFSDVLKKIVTDRISEESEDEVIQLKPETEKKTFNLRSAVGWAAAAVFLIFFGVQYQQSNELKENLSASVEEKKALESKINEQEFDLAFKENLLTTITSDNTRIVDLAGQKISPESNVKVFWNTQNNKVILDASKLPEAPEGMVYQVWSLTLNPLTPTSLGLLEGYNEQNNLFVLENPNASEGFGITLEPEGGSQAPNLEQLYALGTTQV
jgi:anti-sigma-K factor RskA